jgi:hypothetical protein
MQWMHFSDPTRMLTREEMDEYVSKNAELDCITSHHFRVFPPVIAGRPALYITFLREPAGFLISLARHWIRDHTELTPEFRGIYRRISINWTSSISSRFGWIPLNEERTLNIFSALK